MQTQRAAAARDHLKSAGSPDRGPDARGVGADEEPKRRRMAIGGAGRRRVPSPIALKGAERHSRIVRTMRLILPAVALLVVGLVMLKAFMYQADDTLKLSFADMGKAADEPEMQMMQPRFSAQFAGNPINFEADRAYRVEDAPHLIKLEELKGDIFLEGGPWASIAASRGMLDTKDMHAFLGGGIDLFSDLGYELHTLWAKLDLRNGTVTGQSEVKGQGPMGTVRADGFKVMDNGNRIVFKGNVSFKTNQGFGSKRPSG